MPNNAFYEFFTSSFTREIFQLEHTSSPPSWIFTNMHAYVTRGITQHLVIDKQRSEQIRNSFLLAI